MHKLGTADGEARAFVHGTENMAGQNVIAEIRVQIAKLDAQQREFRSLRWMIGLGFTALAILITVLELLD